MTKVPRAPPRARQPTSGPTVSNRAKHLPLQTVTRCCYEVALDISYGTVFISQGWGGSRAGIHKRIAKEHPCSERTLANMVELMHLGFGATTSTITEHGCGQSEWAIQLLPPSRLPDGILPWTATR